MSVDGEGECERTQSRFRNEWEEQQPVMGKWGERGCVLGKESLGQEEEHVVRTCLQQRQRRGTLCCWIGPVAWTVGANKGKIPDDRRQDIQKSALACKVSCPHLAPSRCHWLTGVGAQKSQTTGLHLLSCPAALQPGKACLCFWLSLCFPLAALILLALRRRSRAGPTAAGQTQPWRWLSKCPPWSCARPRAAGTSPGQAWAAAASQSWWRLSRG